MRLSVLPRLLPLLVVLATFACRTAPSRSASPPSAAGAEDTVSWIALEHLADGDVMLIVDSVQARYGSRAEAAADTSIPVMARSAALPPEIWASWRAANATGRRLQLPERIGRHPVRTVSPAVTTAGMQQERYVVSRVGFSVSRDSALVDVQRVCGGLCGRGQMLLIVRDPTHAWHVDRTVWEIVF